MHARMSAARFGICVLLGGMKCQARKKTQVRVLNLAQNNDTGAIMHACMRAMRNTTLAAVAHVYALCALGHARLVRSCSCCRRQGQKTVEVDFGEQHACIAYVLIS